MKRRTFIKKSTAAMATALVLPNFAKAFSKEKMIGIQLYTIRDLVNIDLVNTLETLAGIGYHSVEAAGYKDRKFYGFTPKEYRNIVINSGLNPLSTHTNINLADADQTIEDTVEAGMMYIFIPSLPKDQRQTIDQYKQVAENYNKIGEKCRGAGLEFGYHNHAFEFEKLEGEIPYDVLLNNTDPDFVNMQLDLYWMVYAGYDPLDYFLDYPGRFISWHVKDMDSSPGKESTEIGSGVIDFEAIFKEKRRAGMECYFVEQEAFKMNQIESLTKSCEYLKTLKGA